MLIGLVYNYEWLQKEEKQSNLYCCQCLMCTIMVITACSKLQFLFVVV